jgi:hypothetical protein
VFARVLGPWLVIVPGIIALRAPAMGALASDFFKSDLFVWFAGALLVFGGLLIIAFHQYWSSVAAVMISLFGGFWRCEAWCSWPLPSCTSAQPCLWARYL